MSFYHKLVPPEMRYWIYKFRNPNKFKTILTANYPSEKGDFSLAPYNEKQAIFVHITKAAGTALALSIFGKLPYHYTAWQYRVIFGRKKFQQYYKFTFVRNPWDRLYSAYSYLKGGGWNDQDAAWATEHLSQINDFNDFVINWLTPDRLYAHIHFWPQVDFICDNKGTPIIDDLFYFESIETDFQAIKKKIGAKKELAHINASKRIGYQEVYSPEAIERVAQLYAQDIKCLGYKFDSFDRKRIAGTEFVY